MLLNLSPIAVVVLCSLGSLTACANSATSPQPCVVELPVYDATGNRVSYNVASVKYEEDQKSLDLLSTSAGDYRVSASGNRIHFPRVWLGRKVVVTLRGGNGETFVARVPMMRCQQRTSLQHGEKDSGGDVAWSTITGRLAGCKLDQDWWIRAAPMFGGNDFKGSFEGTIEPKDGTFLMDASFRGERHIIVVGKGKEPVKAFAMDLVVGGKNDVGVVDLRSACPE